METGDKVGKKGDGGAEACCINRRATSLYSRSIKEKDRNISIIIIGEKTSGSNKETIFLYFINRKEKDNSISIVLIEERLNFNSIKIDEKTSN